MNWCNPQVIVNIDDLNRRRIGFYLYENKLILDSDVDEFRETKRHKWKPVWDKQWHRLTHYRTTMDRRPVPQSAVDKALEQVRSKIRYIDTEGNAK